MENYLTLFVDENTPTFLDKYKNTKTLNRLKHVTQFCGCDYTKLYSPLFQYTRFDHSLVVAHMTWHFTHDKKETIAAFLHDVGTPCFAHAIDCLYGDLEKQESSEQKIIDVIQKDEELVAYLKEDGISIKDLKDLKQYPILENKSPKLCVDRLDGVLHTCYIWLHTHTLKEIREVYDHIIVLTNEDGKKEIGFQDIWVAEKFAQMVAIYAKEQQKNKNKYVMQFVAEIVKQSISKKQITIEDLYYAKESELVSLFEQNFSTWKQFENTTKVISTDGKPTQFYVAVVSKKRNTIPLTQIKTGSQRLNMVSEKAKKVYEEIEAYTDKKYGYVEDIKQIL